MNRRLVLLATAALAGCGFQLRQTPQLPMRSIALVGFAKTSPLAAALTRSTPGTVATTRRSDSRASGESSHTHTVATPGLSARGPPEVSPDFVPAVSRP